MKQCSYWLTGRPSRSGNFREVSRLSGDQLFKWSPVFTADNPVSTSTAFAPLRMQRQKPASSLHSSAWRRQRANKSATMGVASKLETICIHRICCEEPLATSSHLPVVSRFILICPEAQIWPTPHCSDSSLATDAQSMRCEKCWCVRQVCFYLILTFKQNSPRDQITPERHTVKWIDKLCVCVCASKTKNSWTERWKCSFIKVLFNLKSWLVFSFPA